jgi:RNA recognition motif-containing protein
LARQIEEAEIRRKFSEFGNIKSFILKKKDNYVTYSFIEYETPAQAKAAIDQSLLSYSRMHKQPFFERILKVEYGNGGSRGLAHYHINRYDRPRPEDQNSRRDRSRSKSRESSQSKRSPTFSHSSDSYSSRRS